MPETQTAPSKGNGVPAAFKGTGVTGPLFSQDTTVPQEMDLVPPTAEAPADGTPSTPEAPVSVEEKRIRDAQAKMHEATTQAAEMRRGLEDLTTKYNTLLELNARQQQAATQHQPVADQGPTDEQLTDLMQNRPKEFLNFQWQMMNSVVQQALDSRFKQVEPLLGNIQQRVEFEGVASRIPDYQELIEPTNQLKQELSKEYPGVNLTPAMLLTIVAKARELTAKPGSGSAVRPPVAATQASTLTAEQMRRKLDTHTQEVGLSGRDMTVEDMPNSTIAECWNRALVKHQIKRL